MWRLIKFVLGIAVAAGVGVVAYAYIGPVVFPADFAAPSQQITAPVTLEVN